MELLFSEAVVLQSVVYQADHCVGSLPSYHALVDEVVDLVHIMNNNYFIHMQLLCSYLARDGFTAHSKESALPWSQKVYRSWLQRITREVHLLSKVKAIVAEFYWRWSGLGSYSSYVARSLDITLVHVPCLFAHRAIQWPPWWLSWRWSSYHTQRLPVKKEGWWYLWNEYVRLPQSLPYNYRRDSTA